MKLISYPLRSGYFETVDVLFHVYERSNGVDRLMNVFEYEDDAKHYAKQISPSGEGVRVVEALRIL